MHRRTDDHFAACLLGGALGDALGWPVEFLTIGQIRTRFGPTGLTEPVQAPSGILEITDDTQMTLFTAEGLIRAGLRGMEHGTSHIPASVHKAYGRWYRTQTERCPPHGGFKPEDGWLITNKELWSRRAPGMTCLAALRDIAPGKAAPNDSKGCGTVMRTAPVGLTINAPFALAGDLSGLTHGHATAGLSAGFLSELIRNMVEGATLDHAVACSREALRQHEGHHEVLRAVDQARILAKGGAMTPELLETLGGGWVAEEAVAIALVAAWRAESFEHGIRLAVNHSGDSDSTGAIAGNLLGLMMGMSALPSSWLAVLELRGVIDTVARDLFRAFQGVGLTGDAAWTSRYPT